MSTTTRSSLGVDHWFQLPADWGAYQHLLRARGERSRPKYTFVDGRLTAVSPGMSHEVIKTRLGGLIEDMLVGLQIDFLATGEVTLLRTRRPRTGAEADESYYLTNLDRVRGKKDVVMGEDPPPDLVIEVVVSHPAGDALEAYRRFGAREVWVYDEAGLEFLVLGADGRYAASPTSALLPFLAADEMASWVSRQDIADDGKLRRLFRAWVDQTLAPRDRPQEQ